MLDYTLKNLMKDIQGDGHKDIDKWEYIPKWLKDRLETICMTGGMKLA